MPLHICIYKQLFHLKELTYIAATIEVLFAALSVWNFRKLIVLFSCIPVPDRDPHGYSHGPALLGYWVSAKQSVTTKE